MADLQVFEFSGQRVRTTGTFEAPLFCAADVCEILTLGDVSQACRRLDQDDVTLQHHAGAENKQNRIGGGIKKSLYVTESGLYALILGCEKPEARAFKKWVTSEVLPEIRKRGYYSLLEAQQRKQTELLLGEIFPNAPTKAAPIFRELIAILLRVRGEREMSGNPPWARMLASWIYGWAIPVNGQQQHRRALNVTPSGSSIDHSMLSDDAREQVKRVADIGVALARNASNWKAWRTSMEVAFGKKAYQLPLIPDAPELPLAERPS